MRKANLETNEARKQRLRNGFVSQEELPKNALQFSADGRQAPVKRCPTRKKSQNAIGDYGKDSLWLQAISRGSIAEAARSAPASR
jgi:hypothetical protein